MWEKLKARLREPSTYAGLGVIGATFGVKELAMFGAPEFCAVLAALGAIALPEKK